jgi:hypothetical protein
LVVIIVIILIASYVLLATTALLLVVATLYSIMRALQKKSRNCRWRQAAAASPAIRVVCTHLRDQFDVRVAGVAIVVIII